MLNRSTSLATSTSVLEALPGKLDIKRHSPSILYLLLLICSSLSILTRSLMLHSATFNDKIVPAPLTTAAIPESITIMLQNVVKEPFHFLLPYPGANLFPLNWREMLLLTRATLCDTFRFIKGDILKF